LLTAVWVLDSLTDNVALLLCDAQEHLISNCLSLKKDPNTPSRTAHWLILNLHQLLYLHIRSERLLSKKQGTVILRTGGDPVAVLHATVCIAIPFEKRAAGGETITPIKAMER
jgi:hypothetical protein